MDRNEPAPTALTPEAQPLGNDVLPAAGQRVAQPARWKLPGFGPLAPIETDFGNFPAQTLRVRDRVRTRNGMFAQIVWLDRLVLNEDFMHRHPEAQPVLIRAGAIGLGMPKQDVLVSPGQMICLGGGYGPRTNKLASELVGGGKAIRRPEPMFTYTLFHCGTPVEVHVDGVWMHVDPDFVRAFH